LSFFILFLGEHHKLVFDPCLAKVVVFLYIFILKINVNVIILK